MNATLDVSNPISDVANAVTSVSDLVRDILDRADRDGPEKESNENLTKIQNSFANNSLDEQYRIMYKLFTNVGHPPTPGGDVGATDREFRHNALLIANELILTRKYLVKTIAKLTK